MSLNSGESRFELGMIYNLFPNDFDNAYKYALLLKKEGFDICKKGTEKASNNSEINKSKEILKPLLDTDYRYRALSALGDIGCLQGNYEEAKEYYETLLRERPNSYWVRIYLGEIELRLGNREVAKEHFEIVVAKDMKPKDRLRATLGLGQIELVSKQFEQAKEHFEFVKTNGSQYGPQYIVSAISGLGEAEFGLKNYEKAREYLLMAISRNVKEKYWVMILLGNIEFELKNLEKSKEYYRIVRDECKRKKMVLMAEEGLAEIEFYLRNYSEARKLFNNIVDKVDPSKKKVIKNRLQTIAKREYELGEQAYQSGNLEEAVVHLKNALDENNQKYYWVMIILGNVYIALGNLDEARKYYETVRKESDLHKLTAIRGLGDVEFFAGNYAKAKQYFLTALESGNGYGMLDGKQEAIIKNRLTSVEIELGKNELQLGNLYEARKYYETVVNGSDAPSIRDKKNIDYAKLDLGEIEYSLGNAEKSIEYFDELIKGDSSIKVRAILNMVRLYIKQKDYLSAFKYFSYLDGEMIAGIGCRPAIEVLRLYLMHYINLMDDLDHSVGYRDISYVQRTHEYDDDYGRYVERVCDLWSIYDIQQAFKYDDCVAVEHIVDKFGAEFSEGVDIYGLFDNIRGRLLEEYKLRRVDGNNDIYDIPYKNIGKSSNVLRVVTIPNTDCILTMYPLVEDRDYFDDKKTGKKLVRITPFQ